MYSTAVNDVEMAKLAIKNALKGSNARMAVPWRVNSETQAIETGYIVDGHVLVFTIGKDGDNLDFRFYVCLLKNTTLENELDSEKEYEEKTVGDITYKVLKPDEGKAAFAYYTQHGDDVYEIRNRGVSNGWFGVSRSEESEAAFEKFLNSVHFA